MADKPIGPSAGQTIPGHPNLLRGNPDWKAGTSGNPEGVSKYQANLRRLIEEQETPDRVLQVIDAMREDALAHEKFSASAAKVYLGAVGVRLDGSATTKVDLSDAPPEVMDYLRKKIPN